MTTTAEITQAASPADKRKRTELVGLRLLPNEFAQVQRLADAWECTPTEVVRRALLRELHQA